MDWTFYVSIRLEDKEQYSDQKKRFYDMPLKPILSENKIVMNN